MTDDADALAGFAALMAGAGQEAAPADPAPYGYTKDPVTGEERPKKAPGRPRKSPSLEDLKAARAEAADNPGGTGADSADRPPAALKRRGGRKQRDAANARPAPPTPQYLRNEGGIAKAVNRSYRKLGKLVRVFDAEVGNALIEITRADDEDDITVGDAWEQLAKTNPRVRAFLLRMLAGGAWSQLVWAHAPIILAVLAKDSIRSRIPFGALVGSFLADESEGTEAPSSGTPFEGLTPVDVQAMAAAFAASIPDPGRDNGAPARGDAL